jgi:hypothetical protein
MKTDDLISRIAEDAAPVRRLPSPVLRTALWMAIALPSVLLIIFIMSPRPDLGERFTEPNFVIEITMAFATSVTAAFAAFSAIVPGSARWPRWLVLLPLAVWLGSLGQGCIRILLNSGTLSIGWDWICIPAISMVGAIPAFAMLWMLRRGAPLYPCMTVALGALSATALGAFGLRFFHPQDASIMVLLWQFGTVAMLTALAGCSGRRILFWPRFKLL